MIVREEKVNLRSMRLHPALRSLSSRPSFPALTVLLLCLFFHSVSFNTGRAEHEEKEIASRPLAMGGAFVATVNDASCVYYNPAALAHFKLPKQILTSHRELFGLKELTSEHIYMVAPGKGFQNLGLGIERFGGEKYVESTTTLSYGFRILETCSIGLSLKKLTTEIKDTPSASAPAVDVGVLHDLTGSLRFGFIARNMNSPELNEKLPKIYRSGLHFKVSDRISLEIGSLKINSGHQYDRPVSWLAGQEFRLSKVLTLRGGISTRPTRISCGFGINVKSWILDYAYRSHESLSNTHSVSMGMMF